jgi:hypothetical protein
LAESKHFSSLGNLEVKNKARITADELIAKLSSDPEFTARQQERDRTLQELRAQYRAEQAQLVADLYEVGEKVESVWDLVNTTREYERAIPVLLKHLVKPYSERTREGIARALAVPDARYAWPVLVEEYRKLPDIKPRNEVKDGLAAALSATATDAVIEELIALAKDKSHGSSRLLLLSPLRKSKSPSARRALQELASDPDLAKEIAAWKRR